MKNQTQAVSQHKYNTLVLNSIIIGVIISILTAVFLPVGQGAFFGITFLCLILTTAMLFPIEANISAPSKTSAWKVIFLLIFYGITCMFFYLSGMEILHWNVPYSEYRTEFHEYYSWYTTSVGNLEKLEYQEQKDILGALSVGLPLIIVSIASFLLGIFVFGWKLGITNIPESIKVDFFLLNPACAWFPWKRSVT